MKKFVTFLLMIMVLSSIFGLQQTSAATVKRLYFWQQDNRMYYEPFNEVDGNWFMSFRNMVPGGKYKDSLIIENGSKILKYDLYMQIIPREQEAIKDQLLELISMKVYHNDQLIYDGKATGKVYQVGSKNLQNVIFLGVYKPNEKGKIDVDIELSKDTGIEFGNKLSKIDWKFMVTEKDIINEVLPGTGDTDNNVYIAMISLSLGVIILLISRKKDKKH